MALSPCLMLESNREYNKKCITENLKYGFDEYVLYDQCFEESDKIEGCTLIGHAKERMGWVVPRNALLKYFYDSDFDYAFWIDANSVVSGPTQNDFVTILDNLKAGNLNKCDAIFSTMGIWVSQERIIYKSMDDCLEKVHVIPAKNNKSYNWMHGLVIKNFKKYYNNEYYMDNRCNVKEGTAEDVFFSRLLRRQVNCYLAPTVTINKPTSKFSCDWANSKGTYDYPPTLYDVIDRYIDETEKRSNYNPVPQQLKEEIIFDRCDYRRDIVKPYKPRGKKEETKEQETTHKTVELF